MAIRYGDPVNLEEEIFEFLRHQSFGSPFNRWLIKDWLVGTLGIECSVQELDGAICAIEEYFGISIPEGSLAESIRSASPQELLKESQYESGGLTRLSKFDELMTLRNKN